MKYIEKRLFDGEEIVYCGDFPGIHKFWAWVALLFLGIIVIGIFIFIGMMVHFRTTEFCVTSRRIIMKKGFFTANMYEIELDAIEGAHACAARARGATGRRDEADLIGFLQGSAALCQRPPLPSCSQTSMPLGLIA